MRCIKSSNLIPYIHENDRPKENCLHGCPIVSNCNGGITSHDGGGVRRKNKKVEGLVFDTHLPNFNPMSWSYPITEDMSDIDLELCTEGYDGINNATTYSLHIHRHKNRDISMLLSTCEDIADNYSVVRGKGWGGVGGMFSAGYNVGYKGRISYVAKSPKLKKMPSSTAHSITNRLSICGGMFHDEFSDKNVEFDKMVQLQAEFWPKNRNILNGPACWIVSKDLGNPKHIDDDFSRSYAGWFTKQKIDNKSAWFLFPDWGVAIELCNDTWISWDGVNCAHCSSVPHLGDSNNIYSLFTAITKKVYANAEKVNMCESILLRERVILDSLNVKDHISLRWVEPLDGRKYKLSKRGKRKYGNKYRRWLHCFVSNIDYINGTVELHERNKNKRKLPKLTRSEVHNRVVFGWVKSGM